MRVLCVMWRFLWKCPKCALCSVLNAIAGCVRVFVQLLFSKKEGIKKNKGFHPQNTIKQDHRHYSAYNDRREV